jgi:hypothetical protein
MRLRKKTGVAGKAEDLAAKAGDIASKASEKAEDVASKAGEKAGDLATTAAGKAAKATGRSATPKVDKRRGVGGLLGLAIIGVIAAIAVSEGLRNKLLDALFGAEEEFEYTSTTTPNPPSEVPVAS